jgi:hypothetical protein
VFRFFLIFLFLFTISAEDSCDQNIIIKNESFYRKVLSSPGDSSVKKEYLKHQGPCFKDGDNLIEVRGVPILETFVCDVFPEKDVAEYFFSNNSLCKKTSQFFPARNVFSVNQKVKEPLLPENWAVVQSYNATLFYKVDTKFNEMQNINGAILNLSDEGLFTDRLKKPVFPYFVFKNGSWQSFLPLRELFELSISKDRSFNIRIITESPLSYEPENLINTIGLKADLFQVETPEPSNYLISGSNISGVQIPNLKINKKGNSFHGRYIIKLSYPGITNIPEKVITEESFELSVTKDEKFHIIELKVLSKELDRDEKERLLAIINREIPPFYVIKENVK